MAQLDLEETKDNDGTKSPHSEISDLENHGQTF